MNGVIVVDKSLLSHNVMRMLLKEQGFSCYAYHSLEEVKEVLSKQQNVSGIIINSNTFANKLDDYLSWLKEDDNLKDLKKVFLCKTGEKSQKIRLSRVSNATVLSRPFHPTELNEALKDGKRKTLAS